MNTHCGTQGRANEDIRFEGYLGRRNGILFSFFSSDHLTLALD